MNQLSLNLTGHRWSAAQARWVVPLRVRNLTDPRRSPACDGCDMFGLCVMHAVGSDAVRRHAHAKRLP
jgi:hypothetical protein